MALLGSVAAEAGNRLEAFFSTVDLGPSAVIDFLVVAGILYWLYLVLRETRALGIIYGILIIVIAFLMAKLLGLDLLAFLFANLLTLLFVAIPVLFQPELRRALERLGRIRYGRLRKERRGANGTLDRIVEATKVLSQKKIGAIIVLKRRTGLTDLVTAGVKLDAEVSTPLLLNLFFQGSPLHDGAAIVEGDRVAAAGVMLPLSERDYGYTMGARHRAAAGITEQSDAVVLVVSEERGIISLSIAGKISPGIDSANLRQVLSEFLTSPRDVGQLKRVRKAAQRNPKRGKPGNQGKRK
ncbi:MAG: diadenylate cyclase CdaA [bacterium]|nr:diadenylate cyclase CdaA [bacterium]MDZ4248362.1 diadenylate cyclase CdaA [Patescibacteria group bacterium]